MRIHVLLRGFLCIALFGTGLMQRAHSETLVVLGDDKYYPVIYLDNGKPAGLLVDLLKRISARTGDDYHFRLSPWNRAYELARQGEGAIVGISKTPERLEKFDYSDPVFKDDVQIVVHKAKAFAFEKLSDLRGKAIGGVLGATYGEAVDTAVTEGVFSLNRHSSQAIQLRAVLAGRLDGALVGNGMAGYQSVLASTPELSAQKADLQVLAPPLVSKSLYLAAAKVMDSNAAIERFNKALRDLQKAETVKPPAPEAAPRR